MTDKTQRIDDALLREAHEAIGAIVDSGVFDAESQHYYHKLRARITAALAPQSEQPKQKRDLLGQPIIGAKSEQPADGVVVLWEPIMSEREALVARLTAFINHFKFADDAMRGEAMSLLTELRGTALTAPAVAEKVDAEEKNHGWI